MRDAVLAVRLALAAQQALVVAPRGTAGRRAEADPSEAAWMAASGRAVPAVATAAVVAAPATAAAPATVVALAAGVAAPVAVAPPLVAVRQWRGLREAPAKRAARGEVSPRRPEVQR